MKKIKSKHLNMQNVYILGTKNVSKLYAGFIIFAKFLKYQKVKKLPLDAEI